jgi:hypothetical protein
MTSIKNKPLKKIVCDKRVTIDSLHSDKVKNINKNNKSINNIEDKITDLQNLIINTNDINEKIKLDNKLINLKNQSESLNKDEYVDYYLDNGVLLSDYYNEDVKYVNKVNNNKKSVIDFMNKSEDKTEEEEETNSKNKEYDMIKKYMINIDDNYTDDFLLTDINICKMCKNKLFIKSNNSELICNDCGYTEKILVNLDSNNYKDPIRESTYFAYKRINHFNEWLAQFQAKETNDISQEIYNNIFKELKKDKNFSINNVTYKLIRDILKKLGYNKYYEHISHIINIITGKKSPTLDRNNEERLRSMFKEIQQPFQNNCPEERKNFLSYSYVLHKFCQLLELDELLIFFPLLKSREKLQQQDFIWKKICNDLKWEFIPSI